MVAMSNAQSLWALASWQGAHKKIATNTVFQSMKALPQGQVRWQHLMETYTVRDKR